MHACNAFKTAYKCIARRVVVCQQGPSSSLGNTYSETVTHEKNYMQAGEFAVV